MDTPEAMGESYYLTPDMPVVVERHQVSLKFYESLKRSKEILTSALRIEERYELLLGNYIAFEKILMDSSIENMSRNKWYMDDQYYTDAFKERMNINRFAINLLTSAKMYMDQMVKDIRTCNESDELSKEYFKKITGEQYDKFFEYRFMEALRNHVQHYGFPASSVTANTRTKKAEESFFWYYITLADATKKELSKNDKFKKAVLNEMPDKVELGNAIRVYMASISDIQEQVRQAVSSYVDSARDEIEKVVSSFCELDPTSDSVIVSRHAGPSPVHVEIDSFSVMLMHDDVRIRLQNQNSEMTNLPRRMALSNFHKTAN